MTFWIMMIESIFLNPKYWERRNHGPSPHLTFWVGPSLAVPLSLRLWLRIHKLSLR